MQLKKVINHSNTRWRVSLYLDGNRIQRFFVTKKLALKWIKELKSDKQYNFFWNSRSTSEQKDIIAAFNIAQEKNTSLLSAILDSNNQTVVTPKTIIQLVPHYLSKLQNRTLRDSTLKQTKLMLNQLSSKFGNLDAGALTASHIEEWFSQSKWVRSTIDGVIAKIGPFFSWCVREGFCKTNPCHNIKRPMSEDKPPAIFTPLQAERLLLYALKTDPTISTYLAIGLFAGIRPTEIERLKPTDIHDHYIEISAAKSKTRQRRLVSISENLNQWLKLSHPINITNKRKRISKLLHTTGLNWSPDIMRHSFASYHLALHQSADKTAFELGHRDSNMLFSHYRELVSFADAKKYWSIIPK